MPNWCENDLYFSGPEDEVLKFKKLVGLDKTPPQPVIEKLFELFPAVRFELEYFECGVAFCGGLSYDPEDDETRSWSGEYSGSRGG